MPGRSWVMVIDLSKCRNARECMKACQSHHQLRPEQHHINVLQMQDSEAYCTLLHAKTLSALRQSSLHKGMPGKCHF